MVKGITKQAVVVRSPEPELFEQAIFIVRGDAGAGITAEDILHQAQQAANHCITPDASGHHRRKILLPFVWLLSGAAAMGLIWLLSALLF